MRTKQPVTGYRAVTSKKWQQEKNILRIVKYLENHAQYNLVVHD